jgi:hypothetical protein
MLGQYVHVILDQQSHVVLRISLYMESKQQKYKNAIYDETTMLMGSVIIYEVSNGMSLKCPSFRVNTMSTTATIEGFTICSTIFLEGGE